MADEPAGTASETPDAPGPDRSEPGAGIPMPKIPLGPGRAAYSRRTRLILAGADGVLHRGCGRRRAWSRRSTSTSTPGVPSRSRWPIGAPRPRSCARPRRWASIRPREAGAGTIESRARSTRPQLGRRAARARRGRACVQLRTPTGQAVGLAASAREGRAARVLRHLVPPLRRRGAAPEGDVRGAAATAATRSCPSTPTARTRRASLPSTSTSGFPYPGRCSTRAPIRGRSTMPGSARARHRGLQGRVRTRPSTCSTPPAGSSGRRSGEQPDALLRQRAPQGRDGQ